MNRRKDNARRLTWVMGILCCGLFFCGACQKPSGEGAGKGAAPSPAQAAPQKPTTITTKSGVQMVLIPGGRFLMGDAKGAANAQPAHEVAISSFYMDRCEVTQAQYEDLIGVNPSNFEGEKNPVDRIRWTQAARYCNERSAKEGLAPCYDETTWACNFEANGYRLPTEAEWEYACRAGSSTAYSFGDDPEALKAHAWFKADSEKKTHLVGQKGANPWGLCDMHGNLSEWCNDWYAADAYKNAAAQDPRGPDKGEKRVLRGGSWSSPPEKCTSSFRLSDAPALPDVCLGYDDYGFRCVRRAK